MLIRVRDLKKSFGKRKSKVDVLKGISFDVAEGEFVSIMGPSGSGKTTLSSVLACLMPMSGGQFYFRNKDINKMNVNELAKLRNKEIGFVFQDSLLLEGLSVKENLMLPLLYQDVSKKEILNRAKSALEKVGLRDRLNSSPKKLSGGQKQRVAIARALMTNPRIIFADEPCGALDPESRLDVLKIFQDLNAEHVTIIMVSHSLDDALYSKRIIRVENGFLGDDTFVNKPQLSLGGTNTTKLLANRLQKEMKLRPVEVNGLELNLPQIVPYIEVLANTGDSSSLAQAETLLHAIDKTDFLYGGLLKLEGFTRNPELAAGLYNLLIGHLRSESWRCRLVSTQLLSQVVDVVSPQQRNHILREFITLIEDPVNEVRHQCYLAFRNYAQLFDKGDYNQLLWKGVQDSDARVRAGIAQAALNLDPSESAQLLEKLIQDPDQRVVANAIEMAWDFALALYSVEDQRGFIKQNIRALTEGNNRIKANVAIMVHRFWPDEAEKAIIQLLEHENPSYVASGIFAASKVEPELLHMCIGDLLSSPYQRIHEALKRFYQPKVFESPYQKHG